MPTRREFVKTTATATAGFFVQAPPARRQVFVGRRRVKVVDVHGHLAVPEVRDIIKGTKLATPGGGDQADGGGLVEGEELSSPKFDPFWAKAQELGALVFMHPRNAPGTTQNPRLRGRGGLGNTIGNPLETTVFLSHLIFDGTLDRFPRLRICAAHAGGYLPSYLGRSEAACTRDAQNCSGMKRKFSDYFRDQILIDTMVFREEGLRHLVAEMGAGQIVYGTDMPFPWPVGVDFILNAKFLSDADKEAILGGTLVKLLRIAPKS